MSNSKVIALSALSASLSLIFLVFGSYFSVFDLSCLFMSSLFIMFPLSKGSIKGAIISYLAVFVLSLVFCAGKFYMPILYGVFFGLHPVVNYYQVKTNKNKVLFNGLKLVWFLLTLFLMFYLFTLFTVDLGVFQKFIPIIIIVAGTFAFFVYDYAMLRFQLMTKILIDKFRL